VRRRVPARRGQPRPGGGRPRRGPDGGDAVTAAPRPAPPRFREGARGRCPRRGCPGGSPAGCGTAVPWWRWRPRRAPTASPTGSGGFAGGQGREGGRAGEARVRAAGALPATLGVRGGAVRVGLAEPELERFAAAGESARKVGARDLAACVVQGALGATTVGGTL